MAHLHVHTLLDGTETGPAVIEPDDETLHWHMVDGEKTSIDAFGEGHTHTFDGETTSPPIDRDSNKGSEMGRETKYIGGNVVEVKQEERNGVQVGIIKGYIATWDLDRGSWGVRDRFVKGAFLESLERHRRDNRPVRFKDHHGRTVGGFPIAGVFEDEKGLFGAAEVNLEVQQGREAFSLARQGVLSDFSVGFSSIDDIEEGGIRTIRKAELFEGSIVDEPMNPEARITEVKSAVPFQDLPLAGKDQAWDADAAIKRVLEFTESDEKSSLAFARYVKNDTKSQALLIADVIDGKLTAVPAAVFAAAEQLKADDAEMPEADHKAAIGHIERYYAKMALPSPFEADEKQYFVADDVKAWTERELEKFLRNTGGMSKSAAKTLSDRLDVKEITPDNENTEAIRKLLDEMKSFKTEIAK